MHRRPLEAEQLHTLLALVSAGLGVTLVPDWVAGAHPAGISYARIEDRVPRHELLLASKADVANPAVPAFRQVAESVAARSPRPPAGTADRP